MAAINDLIAKISDANLRQRLTEEVERLRKKKQFGLVYESHLPEIIPLPEVTVTEGSFVNLKRGSSKTYVVKAITGDVANCLCIETEREESLPLKNIQRIAVLGEPVYPYLKLQDSVIGAPDSDLWHSLIEADNYHALQLLLYLYAGQVDCIYIDPPYNKPDSHDWKYNCNYVDSNDSYRHSKWLSMLETRLKIAKKLLNPKSSVLIVTIDELEYHHLGCLLEQMFPEARIQMITSVISAKGVVRAGQFSRVEEYVYIVELGISELTQFEYNMLDSEVKKDSNREIEWLGFRRRAPQAKRETRPNQFYPIFVDTQKGVIHSIGDVLPHGVDRNTVLIPDGCQALWPLSKDGDERLWSLQQKQALIN